MRLLNSAEPVLYEDVLEFGNYLGVKLPEDYVEFIVNANGETPEPDMLYDFYDEVSEQENTSVIRRFFSFFPNVECEKNNIKFIYNVMRREKTIPVDMIPIADDPTGNVICISLSSNDYGAVYFLNHEFEDSDTGYLMKSKITDSFKVFIEKLYPDEW